MDGDPSQGSGRWRFEALDHSGLRDRCGSPGEVPGQPRAPRLPPAPRAKPKLAAFLGVIDEILDQDTTALPKQRHTAQRIFERLRDEYGHTGCSSQVRAAVAVTRQHRKEVLVSLSHAPRHAQFDFGHATVAIDGEEVKAALCVVIFPYPDVYFVSAYPRECTETFHQEHVSAFEFFGAVPLRTSYDNTSIAISKIVGTARELTREFLRIQSHFLFAAHFCHVRRDNEKRHVETHAGYSRRNLLVPVPSFSLFAQLNENLVAACYADLFRAVRGKPEGNGQHLEVDRTAMLALPTESFEARRVESTRTNSFSLVRFGPNDRSAPITYAHHDVTCHGGIDEVRAL